MRSVFCQARQMNLGICETWHYMVDRCKESYEQIWDFVVGNWEDW